MLMSTKIIQDNEIGTVEDEVSEIVADAKEFRYKTDPHAYVHSPNRIPVGTRWKYILQSFFLIGYGTFGVWIGDLYVPGKRGEGVHLHGVPMLFMYIAMLSASANMISVIIDHYDLRNNEHDYREFAKVTAVLGWSLFFVALLLAILLSTNFLKSY